MPSDNPPGDCAPHAERAAQLLEAMGLTVGLSLFLIVTFVLTIFGGQLAALIGRLVGPRADRRPCRP